MLPVSLFRPRSDIDLARRAAYFYRQRHGFNPLPSHPRFKHPIGEWAQYQADPVGSEVLDHWTSPNVQLVCGVRWGLAVIDLDGELAVQVWDSLVTLRPRGKTWVVRTGSGNWHLYFRIPPSVKSLPSRLLWDGGERHQRIDLLADRSLVVAPPSYHIATGGRYEFSVGPADLPRPMVMPQWLIDLALWHPPAEPFAATQAAPCVVNGHYDRRAVMEAIPDKVGLVRSWGLCVLDRVYRSGWRVCRAIGRPDLDASAGFHPVSGYYCEPPKLRMSLFDVAVRLGVYATWQDAVNGLGQVYGVKA